LNRPNKKSTRDRTFLSHPKKRSSHYAITGAFSFLNITVFTLVWTKFIRFDPLSDPQKAFRSDVRAKAIRHWSKLQDLLRVLAKLHLPPNPQ
jgi:hypothetical protein